MVQLLSLLVLFKIIRWNIRIYVILHHQFLHAILKNVVRVIRDDEAGHRDVNHSFANIINEKKHPKKEENISSKDLSRE